jgi:hypothetical protein
MNSEINDQTCYSTENFYSSDWWDKWFEEKSKEKDDSIFQNSQTTCDSAPNYPWL